MPFAWLRGFCRAAGIRERLCRMPKTQKVAGLIPNGRDYHFLGGSKGAQPDLIRLTIFFVIIFY
jgi:hypothetical protein